MLADKRHLSTKTQESRTDSILLATEAKKSRTKFAILVFKDILLDVFLRLPNQCSQCICDRRHIDSPACHIFNSFSAI